jgi:hypothetical protein
MADARATEKRVERLIERGASAEEVIAVARASAAPSGQCRVHDGKHDSDYIELRPVLDSAGLRWCCAFDHCSGVVSPLVDRS